jgi:hypothetical protein
MALGNGRVVRVGAGVDVDRCGAFSTRRTADDPGPDRGGGVAGTGHTGMRYGFPGLAPKVQEVLRRDPLGITLRAQCSRAFSYCHLPIISRP